MPGARLVSAGRDMADMLFPAVALVEGVETLQHDAEVPRLFVPNTVVRPGRLAEPKDGVQSVTLATYHGSAGQPVVLSDAVRSNAAQAVKPFEVSCGSVSGPSPRCGTRGPRAP